MYIHVLWHSYDTDRLRGVREIVGVYRNHAHAEADASYLTLMQDYPYRSEYYVATMPLLDMAEYTSKEAI